MKNITVDDYLYSLSLSFLNPSHSFITDVLIPRLALSQQVLEQYFEWFQVAFATGKANSLLQYLQSRFITSFFICCERAS